MAEHVGEPVDGRRGVGAVHADEEQHIWRSQFASMGATEYRPMPYILGERYFVTFALWHEPSVRLSVVCNVVAPYSQA